MNDSRGSLLSNEAPRALAWSEASILDDYRLALRSRFTDDVEDRWKKNGRIKFNILGAGQEIAQICAVRGLKPGDWMRGYYRGLAEALYAKATTVRAALAQVLGDASAQREPASGGRMMGHHFGSRLLDEGGELIDLCAQINRGSDISSVSSQMGPALGMAMASRVFRDVPELARAHPRLSRSGNELVHVSLGDASMAEGIALESIFQAAVQRLPLVISVYDNGYGISVPVHEQVPFGSVSRALAGLARNENDESGVTVLGPIAGWDYVACRRAYEEALESVRAGLGPALVHCIVTQPRGHSSSGDHRRYKDEERLVWENRFDCLVHMRAWMLSTGVATDEELAQLEAEERRFVEDEASAAWNGYYEPIAMLGRQAQRLFESAATAFPSLSDACIRSAERLRTASQPQVEQGFLSRTEVLTLIRSFLIASRDLEGRDDFPRTELVRMVERIGMEASESYGSRIFADGAHSPCNAPFVPARSGPDAEQDTGAHILAAGVATLMSADPRVVTFGEDTGRIGGVTTCSLGLQRGHAQVLPEILNKSPALRRFVPRDGFGVARVWDTAIAEGSLVGLAAGLAVRGLRPLAEIQYHDYANYGIQQIIDELACLRHRTAGGQECPSIVWCQGHRLLGMWHSGSPMGLFLTVPGLRVLVPRNPIQAVGMYRATLLHGRDPAFAVVPLLDLYAKLDVPDNLDEVCIPLGHSEVLREGSDATIVTYGHCCSIALQAAEALQTRARLAVEVVDLQTLNPLDLNGVARASVRKTGRVLFFDEDYPNGAASMVASALLYGGEGGHSLLYDVEAVRLLTAPEHKPCYGEDGGFFSKPQVEDVVERVLSLWNDSLLADTDPLRAS